ncbi:MAG TPA: hypothetical protein VF510_17400 [Ktedonobacterales bacterium]
MFPIAHAWLVEQLIPVPAPAHYLGCVWPDMLFGSPLSHTQSHRSGALLTAQTHTLGDTEDAQVFRAFVAGVLTHGSEPHGFDWYSDEQYRDAPEKRGYAFQHGRAIADETARACGIAREQGWWKAHNLVEIAFERPLYLAQPSLGERLAGACGDEALHRRIANVLSHTFHTPADELEAAMRRFLDVVQLRPASIEAEAESYAVQVRLKHAGAQPDTHALAALIEWAEQDIAADKQDYLTTVVRQVGEMLHEMKF